MKERKKDLLIAAVLCFAVMFLIPTVLVQVLEGTNSTLAAFIMWYAMFPCFAVGLGWWAGWDVRHRWLSVILCGLFYMLGDLITYGKFDRMLLIYGLSYAGMAAAAMGLCYALYGGKPKRWIDED
ncbi:MAG: hypothetical protein IJA84_06860 [Clostridia bacterium]|nr:hypothetical protein [Clostridia bacterium]